jgi:hypothetical protein
MVWLLADGILFIGVVHFSQTAQQARSIALTCIASTATMKSQWPLEGRWCRLCRRPDQRQRLYHVLWLSQCISSFLAQLLHTWWSHHLCSAMPSEYLHAPGLLRLEYDPPRITLTELTCTCRGPLPMVVLSEDLPGIQEHQDSFKFCTLQLQVLHPEAPSKSSSSSRRQAVCCHSCGPRPPAGRSSAQVQVCSTQMTWG